MSDLPEEMQYQTYKVEILLASGLGNKIWIVIQESFLVVTNLELILQNAYYKSQIYCF